MSEQKNKHLTCVLKSHNIENNESLMKAYRKKRDEVREDLKGRLGTQIYRVLHSGSYKKKTAVNIKFDMDLVIPFKRDGSETLQNNFESLYKYFDTEYRKKDNSLLEVKPQKVAIGLMFRIENHFLDLDIVPGREIDNYEKDGNLNLFVNLQMGVYAKATYLKTNIQKQIDNISGNFSARQIIQLFKVWKRRNNQTAKSFVIELVSIKALESYSGSPDLWSKLEHSIVFIRDNIKTIKLVDPGNSNNVISDSLDDFQKQVISDSMKWMLEDIRRNESMIERYFPINPEYPCDEQKQNVYIVSDNKKPERLNNEDFG
jgi:hypothetical protein